MGGGETYYIKGLSDITQFEGALVHLFYGNEQPLYDEMNLASAHQGLDRLEGVLSELSPQEKMCSLLMTSCRRQVAVNRPETL